jgi:hypothetical protein
MVRKIKGEIAQANAAPRTNFTAESWGVSPAALAASSRKNNPAKI